VGFVGSGGAEEPCPLEKEVALLRRIISLVVAALVMAAMILVLSLHQRQRAYRGACTTYDLERREDEHELLHTGRREP
jgi:hypothetical protein